jgi:hypothetical protein
MGIKRWLLLGLLLLANCAQGQLVHYWTNFQGTYSGNVPAGWTLFSGSVSVGTNQIGLSRANAGLLSVYLNNAGWTNYAVQCQMKVTLTNASSWAIGLYINNVNISGNGYWGYADPENSGANGGPAETMTIDHTWAGFSQLGVNVSLPNLLTNWHTFTLSVYNGVLSGMFDNKYLGAFPDSTYKNGTIGLGAFDNASSGTHCSFVYRNLWVWSGDPKSPRFGNWFFAE